TRAPDNLGVAAGVTRSRRSRTRCAPIDVDRSGTALALPAAPECKGWSVTNTALAIAGSQFSAAGDGPYIPGPSSFELPAVFEVAGLGVTKPMLLLAFSVV